MTNFPSWLEVRDAPLSEPDDASLAAIDAGEKAAIQLAVALHADLLLMDDRKGVSAAERRGLRVTGTLGVLDLAAERGLVDFGQRLRSSNERVSGGPKLYSTTYSQNTRGKAAILKRLSALTGRATLSVPPLIVGAGERTG